MKGIIKQIIFFVVVFNIIAFIRELSMLSTGDSLQAISPNLQQLTSLTGKNVNLMPDQQKSIAYFFAPWCQICEASISNLEALKQQQPKLNIVAIALDYQSPQDVEQFVAKHQLTMPIVLGDNQLKTTFKIKGYPSYYVIEQQQIVAKSLGYSTETGLWLRSL